MIYLDFVLVYFLSVLLSHVVLYFLPISYTPLHPIPKYSLNIPSMNVSFAGRLSFIPCLCNTFTQLAKPNAQSKLSEAD